MNGGNRAPRILGGATISTPNVLGTELYSAVEASEPIRDERPGAVEPVLRPRMSTIARVASGSAASWVHLSIGFASQLFLVPLFLSHWTPREYGIWIAVGAVGSLIQFLDFGHHNYIGSEALRLGAQSRDQLSRLYGSAVRIALIASVVELALIVGLVRHGVLGALLGEQRVGDALLRNAGLILILQSTVWLVQGNWSAVAIRVLLPFGYFRKHLMVSGDCPGCHRDRAGSRPHARRQVARRRRRLPRHVCPVLLGGNLLYQKGDCEGAALGAKCQLCPRHRQLRAFAGPFGEATCSKCCGRSSFGWSSLHW